MNDVAKSPLRVLAHAYKELLKPPCTVVVRIQLRSPYKFSLDILYDLFEKSSHTSTHAGSFRFLFEFLAQVEKLRACDFVLPIIVGSAAELTRRSDKFIVCRKKIYIPRGKPVSTIYTVYLHRKIFGSSLSSPLARSPSQ